MKISTKLILLFSFLSIIIVLVGGIVFLVQSENSLSERIKAQFESIAVLKQSQLNHFLNMGINNMREIVELDLIKNYNSENEENILKLLDTKLIHTGFTELFIMNLEGEVKTSTNLDQVGKIKEDRVYFNEGKKETFIQNFYYGMSVQGPTMIISTPIKNYAGEIDGVLVGRINIQEISNIMLERSGLGLTGETFLVNKFNFAVSELKKEKDVILKKVIHNEPLKDCLDKNNGFTYYEDYVGDEVVGLYMWIPEREVCLLVEMNKSEAFNSIKQLRIVIGLIMFLAILFSIVTSFFISRSLSKPINDLSQKVDEISKGKLDVQLGNSNLYEIQILTDSLNRVLASLKLAILRTGAEKGELGLGELKKAKKELEKKYQVFFENANDLIQRVDANGNFLEVNKKWREVLGYSMEEVLNLSLKNIIHPDHISYCMQKFQNVLKGNNVSNVKTILLTKSGKEISVEVNASPVFDINGKFSSTVGIFRIIDEKSSGKNVNSLIKTNVPAIKPTIKKIVSTKQLIKQPIQKNVAQKISNSANKTTKKIEEVSKKLISKSASKKIIPKENSQTKKYFLSKR